MSAHTPGPWVVESLHNADSLGKVQWRITAAQRQRVNRVADIYPDLSEHWDKKPPGACLDECAADARLIAAAPELLDEVRKAADQFAELATTFGLFGYPRAAEACRVAERSRRAAIAKAEGK